MMTLKAGTRVKCAVCDTQVMVVRCTAAAVDLSCGGVGMIGIDAAKDESLAHVDGQSPAQMALVGKRYVNGDDSVELLCTKAGKGSLSLDGQLLQVKQAKALPSSD